MAPESEIKSRSGNNMEAPHSKDKVVVKEVENKYRTYVGNYEDYMFELDAYICKHTKISKEADAVNIGRPECNTVVEEKCQETSESSSSFGDVFEVENGGALTDGEVISGFREDDSFYGHGESFRMRKKRATPQWKEHTQSLMWRCKWVELQIKKLNMLEHNYAEELKKYDQEEALLVDRSTTDLCTKEAMKRKKRKRIEEKMDFANYMSQHNLFSYYEIPENNKAPADGICFFDESKNLEKVNCNDEFGLDDDEPLRLKSSEIDETLEAVVRKIEILKGQVSKLKTRLHKVTSVNTGRFSHTAKPSLLVRCNALTSSGPDSASFPNNGDRVAVGSSFIASQLMSIRGEIEDEILIYNDGMNNFGEVNMQPPAAVKVDRRKNNFEEVKMEPPAAVDQQKYNF